MTYAQFRQSQNGRKRKSDDGDALTILLPEVISLHKIMSPTGRARLECCKTDEAVIAATCQSGTHVKGHGVFLGLWGMDIPENQPTDQLQLVFAAQRDLMLKSGERLCRSFLEVADTLVKVKNYGGYDARFFESQSDLFKSIKEGSYNGEWVVPPPALVSDCIDHGKGWFGNMYSQRWSGALKGTFEEKAAGSTKTTKYLTCPDGLDACLVDMKDGMAEYGSKYFDRGNIRLVRFERLKLRAQKLTY